MSVRRDWALVWGVFNTLLLSFAPSVDAIGGNVSEKEEPEKITLSVWTCKLDTSVWLVGGHMGTLHYRPSILLLFSNVETSCFLIWYPIPGFGSPGFLLGHESAIICFSVLPRHFSWQQTLAGNSFVWLYTNFYVKRELLTIWSILFIYWKKSQVFLNTLWYFWTTSYDKL